MPLSNEMLLKPRIRVIAPYPNSPYKIGDLMESSGDAFYLIKFDSISVHLCFYIFWQIIVKVLKWLDPEMKGMPPRFEHGSAKGKSPWAPYSIMPSTEENYNAYLAGTYYAWQR